jgi:AbiV family abortive infection protein
MGRRRNYRNSLEFVESGFRSCWKNASELVAASHAIFKMGHHAPAMGLSILAIEELGKLCAISGLLSAKPDDKKSEYFKKSQRDHAVKLGKFQVLPILIRIISRVDPRCQTDEGYARAVMINVRLLEEAGDRVLSELEESSFESLDRWKQKCFYASIQGGKLLASREIVSEQLSSEVLGLAWRSISALDFVLSEGNLERYFEVARIVRRTMTEREHQALEDASQKLVRELLGLNGDRDVDLDG